jgi:hypothetical protein
MMPIVQTMAILAMNPAVATEQAGLTWGSLHNW